MTEPGSSMIRIALRDKLFAHAANAGGPFRWPDVPFIWDRDCRGPAAITVFTDESLVDAIEYPYETTKVAWLLESPRATRHAYDWIAKYHTIFQRVLTFDQRLVETLPNARFTPLGGCWIDTHFRCIHHKTINLSIIASHKRSMEGQKLRHKIIAKHQKTIDSVMGLGYAPIDNKICGLSKFRYSLIIENCRQNFYFSEKLIDCLITGTVPIYWGCPSISLFFDKEGLICFSNESELTSILQWIGPRDYEKRLPAIHNNFQAAQSYVHPEYAVWNGLKDLIS